jgi:hypothetical protein
MVNWLKTTKTPPSSREELIKRFRELSEEGWIKTREQFNDGLVGNTLEDYLGIGENNITLPDAGRYELKAQRLDTGSLTTLLHFDPYPRQPKSVVTHILGPIYGWTHETIPGEWSFRVTMYGHGYTNRGFKIVVNEEINKLLVEFNPNEVSPDNRDWLEEVLRKNKGKFEPVPYWPLDEIRGRVERKLPNTIYVHATSREGPSGYEEFRYDQAIIYEGVEWEEILTGLSSGQVYVDFDARTGHNHGTKFRIKQGTLDRFYSKVEEIFGPTQLKL